MPSRSFITIDGNEAAALVAYRLSEVIAIYPITPSSNMGELADEYAANRRPNLWGTVPEVMEMQSEAGAAGTVHGALQAGAMTTTFTASQGLLLMIPNMFKIAGELTAFCMHVAARTVATHALSIFGDHSDVMACRGTGFAMLASGSVQEAHDFALVGHAASLRARIPFLHFFEGFRVSHEVAKIVELSDHDLRALVPDDLLLAHRARALTPDRPVLRGTAQNPDAFFQAREAAHPFHAAVPDIVAATMDALAARTGRRYRPFDYVGHPAADRVIVIIGSGGCAAEETAGWLNQRGERVGVVKVRLYRPFDVRRFVAALPATTKAIGVLDRTKEPGAPAEPLHLDVVAALREARDLGLSPFKLEPRVVGGRYGLSSKEFDPSMVRAVFDNLGRETPRNHFTVGIVDDVSGSSLPFDRSFDIDHPGRTQAVFYGLGADGTVGANKNSIKIIGEDTDADAQGYFVYDSKKSGAVTISHLRFGEGPIKSPYLVKQAGFVACHQFAFLERFNVLELAAPGATFLLNAPHGPGEIWDHLPRELQEQMLAKRVRFFVIDAYDVARRTGMGGRINVVMQTCFFAISGVLPRDKAILHIKRAIEKSYGKKGGEIVKRNFAAVDDTLANLHEVKLDGGGDAARKATSKLRRRAPVSPAAPEFVRRVSALMIEGKGDLLPVSAFPPDGTWPVGTAMWEKRNIALEMPVWDSSICIQCNKCAALCPHAAIRAKIYQPKDLAGAPIGFRSMDFKSKELKGRKYTIQVAPEDCTGCGLCVEVCPAKDKANPRHKSLDMQPQPPLRESEVAANAFFLGIPEADRGSLKLDLKGSQFLQPLFEYSGACAGCGETPYVKLLTQLFGDRLLVANATGCSSIYGGNLPTTPYTVNPDGRGPAWSNSLFEDNAEFGLGFRLAIDRHVDQARRLLREVAPRAGEELVRAILDADQSGEQGIAAQRARVVALRRALAGIDDPAARRLDPLCDYLVKKSVWIVGGDGWAYDIGFGGLDHVLSTGKNVNLLVLDTEVYSNTGGQQSKATPLGAAAKFALAGKSIAKKDLGLQAMGYGNVYVAQVAMGAKDAQTVRAFLEAESWPGPSLIIAYSHCIAHGYDMVHGCEQQGLAVDCGMWPLYRFDPRRIATGEPPLKLDSGDAKIPVKDFMRNEARFRMTEKLDPVRYRQLQHWAQDVTRQRLALYQQMAGIRIPQTTDLPDAEPLPEEVP